MKITLDRSSATPSQIRSLEAKLGFALPEAYARFVGSHDGVEPPLNRFDYPGGGSGVDAFIPVRGIKRELSDDFPKDHFPVADAAGGNYVLVSRDGRVFFWDHETDDVVWLAADFDGFLELLAPLDLTEFSDEIEEGEEVWIDPAFLKKYGKKK